MLSEAKMGLMAKLLLYRWALKYLNIVLYEQLCVDLLQHLVCVVFAELSAHEGSQNSTRISFISISTHALTFPVSGRYSTCLEFKSSEMSCANEKSFLPLKGPLFFCTLVMSIHCEAQRSAVYLCTCQGQMQVNHDIGVEIGM